MLRLSVPLLVLIGGCCACHPEVEAPALATAPGRPVFDTVLCAAAEPAPDTGPLDLPALWHLAQANNPALREAAAEVEAARGQWIQAARYPNPRIGYTEEELGTRQEPAGSLVVEVRQEIITAGKRRLDIAIAARQVDAASVAALGRQFEVLTRIRRAYYDYFGWQHLAQVNDEVVNALQAGVESTQRLVEEVQSRPRMDLLRLQALLEEAKINQARSRINVQAGWRQLAAEVGLPCLPLPASAAQAAEPVPRWDADAVARRVLAAHTDLWQAALDTERARLAVERARAEAVPNVTVGGGYSRNFAENEVGAVVSVETALPLWDRKQGRIQEARARWAKAQAAERSVATRLSRDTAEAFGRYLAARQQVERLTSEVLPRLTQTLGLVRKGYEAGGAQVSFADMLLAEQSLNDTRLRLAEGQRGLGRAVADLQGLMQLEPREDLCEPGERGASAP
jgi:cobalt-zinc-cadmium efflux system outer membrane protein